MVLPSRLTILNCFIWKKNNGDNIGQFCCSIFNYIQFVKQYIIWLSHILPCYLKYCLFGFFFFFVFSSLKESEVFWKCVFRFYKKNMFFLGHVLMPNLHLAGKKDCECVCVCVCVVVCTHAHELLCVHFLALRTEVHKNDNYL